MSSDYFLVHRGLQVQRLTSQEAGNRIEIPPRSSRDGFSPAAVDLTNSLERICKLKLAKAKSGGLLDWVTGRGRGKGRQLSAKQRELIYAFERQLVLARLGGDAAGAKFAAAVMKRCCKTTPFLMA